MRQQLKKLLSYLPITLLPVGLTQFYEFADDIIALSGEYADKDSMRFAIASMVLHMSPNTCFVSKNHFVVGLRKSAANQVASQVFQDVKTKQQKQAEATAPTQPGTSGSAKETTQKNTGN